MNYDFKLDLENKNPLSLIINRIKPNSTILEFGPANGRLTQYLKETLECKIYCVEIDEAAAEFSKKYSEDILVDDIETFSWIEKFASIDFDYIIFADVLEHLKFPELVLTKAQNLLKESGSILISIPNIAHNSVIINLFMNQFEYRNTGILDNTHLRFFTKESFDMLLEKCNLYRHYEDGIIVKPLDTELNNSYNMLPKDVANFMQNLPFGEVYQFVYEVKMYKAKEIISFFDKKFYTKKNDDNDFRHLIELQKNLQSENKQLWQRVLDNEEKIFSYINENNQLWKRVADNESKIDLYENERNGLLAEIEKLKNPESKLAKFLKNIKKGFCK